MRSQYEKKVLETTLYLLNNSDAYENPLHKVELQIPTTYQPDISVELPSKLRFIELKGGYLRGDSARKLALLHKQEGTPLPHKPRHTELVVVTNTEGRVQRRKGSIVQWCKSHNILCYVFDGYLPNWLFEEEDLSKHPCAWEEAVV